MQKDDIYITLKEIAETLGENYGTIRDYKRIFNIHLKARLFGRRRKYSIQNIDLFRYILDLKEDGYSNEDIEAILLKEKEMDGRLEGWVDGRVEGRMDGRMDGGVDEQLINKVVNDVTKNVYTMIKATVDQEFHTNKQTMIEYLKRIIDGINFALAALQENQQKLHKTIIAVNHKVVSMEMALGVESGEELKNDDFKSVNLDIKIDFESMSSDFSKTGASPYIKKEPVETLVVQGNRMKFYIPRSCGDTCHPIPPFYTTFNTTFFCLVRLDKVSAKCRIMPRFVGA